MAITWPVTADVLTNPSATDKTNSPSHATQHANANDALEAIEAYLGTNASQTTPTGSGRVLRSTSATASEWADLVLTTDVTGVLPVANGGTNASSASITAFNNITGYTATGATGTTSTNLVFSTSPALTTPTFITSITGPLLIGGTTTTSTLTLRSTSGVGTTNADIIFQTGNNGATEAMRILNSGNVGIGTVTPGSNRLYVGGGTANQYTTFIEGNSTAGQSYGLKIIAGTNSSDLAFAVSNQANNVNYLYVGGGGAVFINDTSNANMTTGLTINQGAADNEILTLKSSDVAHAMTGITEADTYGVMQKNSSTLGGVNLWGFLATGGSNSALRLDGATTDAADTTKTTGGHGVVVIRAMINSAGSVAAVGADGNLLTVESLNTTRFIFDAEGSAHGDIEWIAFDTHDDIALLDTLNTKMNKRDAVTNAFGEILKYNQQDLQDAGIVNFYDDGPRAMVNTTRLAMLHTGAIRQLYKKLEDAYAKIGVLEQKLLA